MLPGDVGRVVAPTAAFHVPPHAHGPSQLKGLAHSERSLQNIRAARELRHNASSSKRAVLGGEGDDEDAPPVLHEFSHLDPAVQRRVAGLLRMHVLGSVRSRFEVD